MITLKRLEYLAKVAACGSITKAAEQLHISQPALGIHLRELESACGVTLLERHSRGVAPTAAGRLLLERSADIFTLLERTRRELQHLDRADPIRLRLGLTTSLTQLVASDLLLDIQQHLPGVALQLHDSPSFLLLEALKRGEVDAVLAYSVTPDPALDATPVLREPLMLVQSHTHSPNRTIGLEELLQHDLVVGNERDVARRLLDQAAQRLGKPARIKYETHSIASQRALVLCGAAAALLPMGAIAHELRDGSVSARLIEDPGLLMTLSAVRRRATEGVDDALAAATQQVTASAIRLVRKALGSLARPL